MKKTRCKSIYLYTHTHQKKKEGNKNIHICALIERNTEIKEEERKQAESGLEKVYHLVKESTT